MCVCVCVQIVCTSIFHVGNLKKNTIHVCDPYIQNANHLYECEKIKCMTTKHMFIKRILYTADPTCTVSIANGQTCVSVSWRAISNFSNNLMYFTLSLSGAPWNRLQTSPIPVLCIYTYMCICIICVCVCVCVCVYRFTPSTNFVAQTSDPCSEQQI